MSTGSLARGTNPLAALDADPARRSLGSVGGAITAAGSCSVVVTSLFYILSPPAAIAPVIEILPDAAKAAVAGAATMKAAGTFGTFGDLVMGVGALLLAIDCALRGRPANAAGWAFVMMSVVVFEIVDTLVGFVLSPSAAATDLAAFEAFRHLYGVLFLVGTALFGIGAILASARKEGSILPAWLAWLCIGDGVLSLGSALATFVGLPVAAVAGAAISIGSVLFAVVGAWIAINAQT